MILFRLSARQANKKTTQAQIKLVLKHVTYASSMGQTSTTVNLSLTAKATEYLISCGYELTKYPLYVHVYFGDN